MNDTSTFMKRQVFLLTLVPVVLLIFGIYHGLLQTLYRAGIIQASSFLGIEYYQGLTAHGVINAIVLTTFFAVAFGHFLVFRLLKEAPNAKAVQASTRLMLLGSVLAALAIFSGKANVLYTFYPPLQAHPTFYVGLTLAVVGSWVAFYSWIPVYLNFRKRHPEQKTPMGIVGIFSAFIVWQIATVPVAVEILFMLLPWSLGWVDEVNVTLARTLFWFFGHPLVYFWLLPVYVMYYTMLPKLAGGKLYSDFAGRFVFLAFCVLSAPLGLHHQFADPGISSEWKGLHTVLTSLVAVPSMLTAFTLAASLEYAGKKRGAGGVLGFLFYQPYFDRKKWLFPYLMCGLILFIFGGATGIVNASFSVNKVVHNTAWIPAHFHLTVGGPVFLGILGMSLKLLAWSRGVAVKLTRAAYMVPYLWVCGVMTMSSGQFIGGLLGEPRRTNLGLTYLNRSSEMFRSDWQFSTMMAVVGGVIMTIAMITYFVIFFHTLRQTESAEEEIEFAEPLHDEDIGFVRNFRPWVIAGAIACVIAYAPPLLEIFRTQSGGAVAYSPSSPVPVQGSQQK